MHIRLLISSLLVAVATAPAGAGDRLAIVVSPSVAFEPATVTVRATVEVSQQNRALEVIAESDDYYRSSTIPLDGEHAPRTTQVAFRSLPSGFYTVRVLVFGSRGETLQRSEQIAQIVNRTGR